MQFLVVEKGFSEDRVRSSAGKLVKMATAKEQSRLEGFFKPLQKTDAEKASLKRKADEKAEDKKKKRKADMAAKKAEKAKPRGTA